MNQTILSLLALLMVTFLNFNQQRANLRSQQEAVRAQVEQMAVGIAKQSIEVVRARAFDDSTVTGSVPVSKLTAPGNFPTGNDCEVFDGSDVCDSIEDFHKMEPATVEVQLPNGTFEFEVRMEVYYVDSDLNRTGGGTRTERKEVMIEVQDVQGTGDPMLSTPIVFTEVLGYT